MKRWLIALLCWCVAATSFADEWSETAKLASELGMKQEVRLRDGTRCDLLGDTLAIEVDWAKKWPEAIGQSLHYARLTKKRPGIILLCYAGDERHIERCKPIAKQCGITLMIRNVKDEKTRVELLGAPRAEAPDEELVLPILPPPPWIRISEDLAILKKEHEALRARVAKTENKTAEIVSWSQKLYVFLTTGLSHPRPPVVELRQDAPAACPACPARSCCPCFPAAR